MQRIAFIVAKFRKIHSSFVLLFPESFINSIPFHISTSFPSHNPSFNRKYKNNRRTRIFSVLLFQKKKKIEKIQVPKEAKKHWRETNNTQVLIRKGMQNGSGPTMLRTTHEYPRFRINFSTISRLEIEKFIKRDRNIS